MNTILKEIASSIYTRPTTEAKDYIFRKNELDLYHPYIWVKDFSFLFENKPFQKLKEANYKFSINNELFELPYELVHIAENIIESKEILSNEDNWDEEGASATDVEAYMSAVRFVVKYSSNIYNLSSEVLVAPYINNLRDGSVSVLWEASEKNRLHVVFNKNEDYLLFYCEYDTQNSFKGKIKANDVVDETLAIWMKNHLT